MSDIHPFFFPSPRLQHRSLFSSFVMVVLLLSTLMVPPWDGNDYGTVTAQPVPEYQDASNGLPTADLWTCKLVFFDIDNDGTGDLISLGPRKGDNTKDIHVYKWNGDSWSDASLEEGTTNIGHSSYGGHDLADLDNDGDWDIGVGSHGADEVNAYFRSIANTWMDSSTGLQASEDGWDVDIGDFNNDGYLDLAVGGFWGMDLRVYAGNGQGQWVEQSGDFAPGGASRIMSQFADVNNDGNLDVISNLQGGNWCYLGDGNGGWTNSSEGLPGDSYGRTPDTGDFNNDGYIDLAMVAEQRVWAFEGDGTGNWTNSSIGLPSSYTFKSLKLADMNNDGFDDIVGLTNERFVELYLATGTGGWLKADTTSMQGNAQSHRLNVGDFDHNLLRDITAGFGTDDVAGYPGSIKVWRETTIPTELDVILDYPNGLEYINDGSIQFIRWRSAVMAGSGTRTVGLEYSTSGDAGPWTLIDSDLPDTGIYQWEVPEMDASGDCYIRISLADEIGGAVSDVNDNPFGIGINPNLNHRPEITILTPSDENESADSNYIIKWNTTDSDEDEISTDLYYDDDTDPENGNQLIVEDLQSEGNASHEWNTTEIDEGTYYIYGWVEDEHGKNASGYSQGTVRIEHEQPNNEPTLEILEPGDQGGEGEEADDSFMIQWDADDEDGDILTIDLYFDMDTDPVNGNSLILLDLENTGEYNWNCSKVDEGEYYIFGIADDGNEGIVNDYSVGTIIISHDVEENTPPTIEITSPKGNDDVANESYTITWDADDTDGDVLAIDLYYDEDRRSDNGMTLIEAELENTGSYLWNTSEVSDGHYCIVGIANDGNGGSDMDYSDHMMELYHEIIEPNVDPQIDIMTVERYDDYAMMIVWEASDGNLKDQLTLNLYYGTDTDPSEGLNIIQLEISVHSGDHYLEWDITGLEDGDYYIYATIHDDHGGSNSSWSDKITIFHPVYEPDLSVVLTADVPLPGGITEGNTLMIIVRIENEGNADGECDVYVSVDGRNILHRTVKVKLGENDEISIPWVSQKGKHVITVELDCAEDENDSNNGDSRTIFVKEKPVEEKKEEEEDLPLVAIGVAMLIAIVMLLALLIAHRHNGKGTEGEACPKCGRSGEYSNKEQDHYCWNCKNYFEEMD